MNYLSRLYRDLSDGHISVWSKSTRHTEWFPINELDKAFEYMTGAACSEDVYFGWGVQKEPTSGRGKSENTIALPGFFLDVDLKAATKGVHSKNEELPETFEDFLRLVAQLEFPAPTAIRNSGNGAYLDWLFDFPLTLEDDAARVEAEGWSKRFQSAFIAAAKTRGWHLDNVGDFARVTRVPGTLNHKSTPPKPVLLVSYLEENRISFSGLKSAIQSIENRLEIAPPVARGSQRTISARVVGSSYVRNSDLDSIVSGCAWMRSVEERRNSLPEPEWYAAGGIIGRCKDGRELFHRFSEGDPRYDEGETARKLEHALGSAGPRLCVSISADFAPDICSRCPFRNSDLKTPLKLRSVGSNVAGLASRHAFDLETGRYIELNTMNALSEKSFNNKYKHLFGKANPHIEMMSWDFTKKVARVDYLPGDTRLFIPSGDDWLLNGWRRSSIVPVEGETSIIDNHIEHVFPDDGARAHFLNVLAFHFQNPAEKIRHVLLTIGKQGLGKSFFGSLLRMLVGEANTYTAESYDLLSGWTAPMGNKELLIMEELGVFDKMEVYENLKRWVTEDRVVVNEKHLPRYEARTPRLIVGFSNHSTPTSLGNGDRRFFIYDSPASKLPPEYYETLFNDGLQQAPAFLFKLMNRPLEGFSASAEPPMTEAKANIIALSRGIVTQEMAARMDAGARPFDRDFGTTDEVIRSLQDISRAYNKRVSIPEATKAMKELGAVKYRQQVDLNGSRPNIWIWRNHEKWVNASAEEIRNEFGSSAQHLLKASGF